MCACERADHRVVDGKKRCVLPTGKSDALYHGAPAATAIGFATMQYRVYVFDKNIFCHIRPQENENRPSRPLWRT